MPGTESVTMETHGTRARIEELPRRIDVAPWIVHGVASGLVGAVLVAVLFLVRDLTQTQALWTPHTLGSALFLGEAPAASPSAILVLGYTLVHGAVFVALGLLAAVLMPLLPSEREIGRVLSGVVGLFVLLEIVFSLFSALFASERGADLQPLWVAIANLIAALGMAGYLTAAGRSLERAD